jgi:potassium voltage-gated channel Eag-related subfamily H protein 8
VEQEFEAIFIEIINKNVVVGEVYRIPGADCRVSIQRYEEIVNKLQYENKEVILGTDQNMDLLNTSHPYTRSLLDTFYAAGMLPTITRPTRVCHSSATLIDNIYVKSKHLDNMSSGILTLDVSDHFPVIVLIGTKQPTKGQPVSVEYRDLNEHAIFNIQSLLVSTDWSFLDQLDIDRQFTELVRHLQEYIDICAPLKMAKIPYKYAKRNKWMTKGLMHSSRHLCKLRRYMTGKPAHSSEVCAYKKYRNLYNRLVRLARIKYYGELFDSHRNDIASTWRTLNDIIGKSRDKTCCASMDIDGQKVSDSTIISNKFCEYFTNVGRDCAAKIPHAKIPYAHYLRQGHARSFVMQPITPGDVINTLSRMKGKNSSGHDNISSKLLKTLRGEIAFPLTKLINNSLSSGIVPNSLKIAKVIPLYKVKDTSLLSNYRPISLLLVLSKVLEKL